MRRVFQSREQKRRAVKRARDELLKRRSRPARPQKKAQPPVRVLSAGARGLRVLPAPKTFSLIDNTEEVLGYFAEAHSWLKDRRRVQFDLSGVSNMTPDAIALLVASVHDGYFTYGTMVAGNEPTDPTAARMLDESGFYDHVHSDSLKPSNPHNLLLHRVTNSRVENVEAMNAGKLAVRHLYNDGRRLKPLYECLIECMANTNNHADPDRRGEYDWWLFVYNDPHTKRTLISFIDLGVGIFRSLPVARHRIKLMQKLLQPSNVSIAEDLLAGRIPSRTKRSERGKGIPRIFQHTSAGFFKRAVMISNDVSIDLVTGEPRKLRWPFRGTFYYFELSAS